MHSSVSIVVAAAALAVVSAKCPNLCSGHGTCSKDDKCLCWNGYTGADCSLRTCAQGRSWALDNANPHAYSECSNRGLCNRQSGECECFDGFEGAVCDRVKCPNDCSGNGRCRLARDLPNYNPDSSYLTANQIDWEEDHITACVCDPGFFGSDCSLRMCPFGDDPVTTCEQTKITEQVQRITIRSRLTMDVTKYIDDNAIFVGNEFALSFKTPLGYNYTTDRVYGLHNSWSSTSPQTAMAYASAIAADTTNSETRLEMALEGLPNFAIQDVTVAKNADAALSTNLNQGLRRSFDVTFHHESDNQNNYGVQNLLGCEVANVCPGAGCRPKTRQLYTVATAAGKGATAEGAAVTAANYMSPNIDGSTDSFMYFHEESVLQCPTGKTCTQATVASSDTTTHIEEFMAGIIVAVVNPDADVGGDSAGAKVFVAAFGNGDGGNLGSSGIATDDLLTVDADWLTTVAPAIVSTVTGNNANGWDAFQYVGELTSSNYQKFDISDIVPETFLVFPTSDFHTGAGNNVDYYQILAFDPFTCSVADVTESGSPHENSDAENMECSGRGECNRATGACECFSGYKGDSCNMQTVLA